MTTEPKPRANPAADSARGGRASGATAAGAPSVEGADRTTRGPASDAFVQPPQGDGGGGYRTGADRLRAIADRLRVPVESFFAGTGGAIEDVPPVLDLLRHPEAVRLVRAFAAIPDAAVRQRLLSAVEAAAAGGREPGEASSGPGTDAERDGSSEGQG